MVLQFHEIAGVGKTHFYPPKIHLEEPSRLFCSAAKRSCPWMRTVEYVFRAVYIRWILCLLHQSFEGPAGTIGSA
jgi:hypothetical protein